jgi:NAD+ kinase
MKFTVVSKNKDIQAIARVLAMFDLDIDNNKPDFVITYGGDGTILKAERIYPGIPKITIRNSEKCSKCNYSENELEDVLIKIDNGTYKLKEEKKLETTFQGKKYLSLNEAQIHNYSPLKAVRFSVYMKVYMDNLPLFDNIIGDGVVIATPFGSSAYFSSIGGEQFEKGIGIGLNNPYNVKSKPVIIDSGFDPEIHIIILRDDGLLLFDNDENIIKTMGGDDIKVEISKNTAKFVI